MLSVEELENQEHIIISDKTWRRIEVQQIVTNNVFWAVWVGTIPTPFIDIFLVTATQLKMISELSLKYNVQFSKNRSKAIIASLMAGLGTGVLTSTRLMKTMFGIGTISGAIGLAVFAGATTYAIGQIFIKHFESGGTLLDFDAAKFKNFFVEKVKEGGKVTIQVPKRAQTSA